MIKICDLHIHSKFSGGASKNIDIFKIANNCKAKEINIVGTGDCLHPLWRSELNNNLIEYSDGIFFTPKVPDVFFILQSEIEVIWNNCSNVKKVHFILLFLIHSIWEILFLNDYSVNCDQINSPSQNFVSNLIFFFINKGLISNYIKFDFNSYNLKELLDVNF